MKKNLIGNGIGNVAYLDLIGYADEEFDKDQYEYAKKHFVSKRPFIVAINCKTGEEILFHGLTEAANALGMSIASVSNVLREKQRSAKGWYFKYAYPEEDD